MTGFGLAGHGFEMASGSGVTLEIDLNRVPLLEEALAMYKKGVTTGVNDQNRKLTENRVRFDQNFPKWHEEIVFDPQTSGGLLASVPEDEAEHLLKALLDGGVNSAIIIGKTTTLQGTTCVVFK